MFRDFLVPGWEWASGMQTATFFAGHVADQLRGQPYPLKNRTNSFSMINRACLLFYSRA